MDGDNAIFYSTQGFFGWRSFFKGYWLAMDQLEYSIYDVAEELGIDTSVLDDISIGNYKTIKVLDYIRLIKKMKEIIDEEYPFGTYYVDWDGLNPVTEADLL